MLTQVAVRDGGWKQTRLREDPRSTGLTLGPYNTQLSHRRPVAYSSPPDGVMGSESASGRD